MSREDFIKNFAPIAVSVTRGTGIFPQTLLAMAIVESSNSQGEVLKGKTVQYFNLFGIKDSASWKGRTVLLNTPNDSKKQSRFRVYNSFSESMKDYINFLKFENSRYVKGGVFKARDYSEQIALIAKAGYAENPNYFPIVKSIADKINKILPEAKEFSKLILPIAFFLMLALSDDGKK